MGIFNTINGIITINILSYIDSGPKVSKSKIHIIPDGDYQANVFNLIENFNNSINPIGSWHSHHCNGLGELSRGDEKGYFKSVNKDNFPLDFFIAILVTSINNRELGIKYYLFCRDHDQYYEIDHSKINVIYRGNKIVRLLSFLELFNMSSSRYRNRNILLTNKNNSNYEDQKLKQFRLADNSWIQNTFCDVITKRNRITNVISWHWFFIKNSHTFKFVYSHPPVLGRIRKVAGLMVFLNNKRIKRVKIPLNSNRFTKIRRIYNGIVL